MYVPWLFRRFLLFGEPMTKVSDDWGRKIFASFFSLGLRDRVDRAFREREALVQPVPSGYND